MAAYQRDGRMASIHMSHLWEPLDLHGVGMGVDKRFAEVEVKKHRREASMKASMLNAAVKVDRYLSQWSDDVEWEKFEFVYGEDGYAFKSELLYRCKSERLLYDKQREAVTKMLDREHGMKTVFSVEQKNVAPGGWTSGAPPLELTLPCGSIAFFVKPELWVS